MVGLSQDLAPLLLRQSAPRWNIATGLMFHYWGLSTLSVLVAATVGATLNGVHY